MGDRYGRSGRRSPVYDYGRVSAPNITSVGQSSFYGGDIHVIPSRYEPTSNSHSQSQSRHHHRHNSNANNSSSSNGWRGPSVPITTTTYTVKKDPVTRNTSIREHSRTRSSTLDSIAKRPPIIVTTRKEKESGLHTSGRDVPPTPTERDRGRNYREDYYAQPASSIRSRSQTRPYVSGTAGSTLDNEEFHRLRQRTNDDRLAPSWAEPRRERPTSLYATTSPRHGTATADLGDSGYEYTKPSDLVRYDLDNDRRPTYYRPSVTLNERPYDRTSRGPPPTTRGLDKVNKRVVEEPTGGIYDRPAVRMPVPAVVPVPVSDRRNSQLDIPERRSSSRNGHRPTSMYQESPSRSRVDDYPRDPRDRDYYRDDDISKRGYGLRPEDKKDPVVRAPSRDRRRDSRLDDRGREPRRHSDEELDRHGRRERRQSRDHGRRDDSLVRPDNRRMSTVDIPARDDDHDKSDKGKLRDKVTTGLSLAAGAIGLTGALNHMDKDADKDKEEKEEKEPHRRRVDDEVRRDEAEERYKPVKRENEDRPRDEDRYKPAKKDNEDRPRDEDRPEPREKSRKDRDVEDAEDTDRNRRDAEAKLSGEPSVADSSSDENRPRRRPRPTSAFKPNDTATLMALKEQLKAKEDSSKDPEKAASKETSPDRRAPPSPPRDDVEDPRSSKDDMRGREAAAAAADDKQVRVVSPPRDKDDKKPIKGILKQPRPQFPEEPNPVREGVAPHKDDKTKGNVPPGARWTKINRKLVNPEALTIGKERFEVRDDFVIVLRVLNKEEIEAYTAATAQLRGGLLPFPFSCLSFPFVVSSSVARRPSPCRPHRVTSPFDRPSSPSRRPTVPTSLRLAPFAVPILRSLRSL